MADRVKIRGDLAIPELEIIRTVGCAIIERPQEPTGSAAHGNVVKSIQQK